MADESHGERLAVVEHRITDDVAGLRYDLDREIRHVKELTAKDFEGVEKARQIQFTEWMRRLDALNGEAGRLREMQAEYVSREKFDGKVGELEKSIRTLDNFQSNMTGRMAMVGGGIGLASGILAAIVTHFLGK
jgi:hypothetical protein